VFGLRNRPVRPSSHVRLIALVVVRDTSTELRHLSDHTLLRPDLIDPQTEPDGKQCDRDEERSQTKRPQPLKTEPS
jgi:hypothetical protein